MTRDEALATILIIWDRWPNDHPARAVNAMRDVGEALVKAGLADANGLTALGYRLAAKAPENT